MDESAYTRVVYMFIKLTNTSNGHHGDPIYINVDHITAIYDHPRDGGSLVTYVHSSIGSPVTWEVEESVSQVMDLIEEARV
jgi:hypothetical protein